MNMTSGARLIRAGTAAAATATALLCLALGCADGAALASRGGESPPAAPTGPAVQLLPAGKRLPANPTNAVKAVVVKSFDRCDSDLVVWQELNDDWSAYGETPITVDYDNPALCGERFTFEDLESSGAQTVILSDPSAYGGPFTPQQVDALRRYAEEGHTLVGTFQVFGSSGVDNSALAPLFGLREDAGWFDVRKRVHPTYALRVNKHRGPARALFRGLSKLYHSTGYPGAQAPSDGTWNRSDLAGARIIARNANQAAAISVYSRSGYQAIHIANMPEYGGGTQDKQFLYNAIIYPRKG